MVSVVKAGVVDLDTLSVPEPSGAWSIPTVGLESSLAPGSSMLSAPAKAMALVSNVYDPAAAGALDALVGEHQRMSPFTNASFVVAISFHGRAPPPVTSRSAFPRE